MYDENNDTKWATNGAGVGAWIEIQFPERIELSKLETRHMYGGSSSNANLPMGEVDGAAGRPLDQ